MTYPVVGAEPGDPNSSDLRTITVMLGRTGHDEQQNLHARDHVELVVIGQAPRQGQRVFYRVESITPDLHVTLRLEAGALTVSEEPRRYLLRRWESAPTELPDKPAAWVALEDGIEVQFVAGAPRSTAPATTG